MAVQPSLRLSDPPAQVARWSAAALIGLLAAAALLVAWPERPAPWPFAAAGGNGGGGRRHGRRGRGRTTRVAAAAPRRELAAGLLLSAVLLLSGARFCLPGSRAAECSSSGPSWRAKNAGRGDDCLGRTAGTVPIFVSTKMGLSP